MPAYRNGAGSPHILDHDEDLLDLKWTAATPTRATESLQRASANTEDLESSLEPPSAAIIEDGSNSNGDEVIIMETSASNPSTDIPSGSPGVDANPSPSVINVSYPIPQSVASLVISLESFCSLYI